ncbi:hypothetical protein CEV08_08650 [Bartonella tribocorum]|uniref:Uncharacterized protein n=1 Tax=Bartonella tribocorum TaxID=85701 RepID=A0A2N9Y8Q5_9HYPH|nr:hypothetical protein CEV08_08650 [Bartonella tribocorum]
MKKSLKLLSTLLVMVGFYQGYCSQTLAGARSAAKHVKFDGCWDDPKYGRQCIDMSKISS